MIYLRTLKYALLLSAAFLLLTSCSSRGAGTDVAAGTPTEPPFKNDEPDKYQTFVIQKTPSETVRFFIARDGDKWRIDSAHGTPVQTASLHTDKDYVVAFGAGIYSEYQSVHGYDERPDLVREITYGMINSRDIAIYEKIQENGGIVKYKSTDSKGLESIVEYDETTGIPTRKELFSIKDGMRTIETSIWLEEFTTEVDPSSFEFPKEFKRVSPQEMKAALSTRHRTK